MKTLMEKIRAYNSGMGIKRATLAYQAPDGEFYKVPLIAPAWHEENSQSPSSDQLIDQRRNFVSDAIKMVAPQALESSSSGSRRTFFSAGTDHFFQ